MQTVASTNLSRSRRREMKVVSLSATYPYPSSLISSITTVQRRHRHSLPAAIQPQNYPLEEHYQRKAKKYWDGFYKRHKNKVSFSHFICICFCPFFTSWLRDSLLPTWVFVFALFCSSSSRIDITWKKTGVITFLMILVAQMEIRRSF